MGDTGVPLGNDVTLSASPARHITTADACGGGHLTALELVPASASVVAGVDVRSVAQLPAYARHRGSIEVGEVARLFAVATACDVGIGAWQTATLASDAPASNTALVLRASGLGSAERLECLRTRIGAAGGDAPFTLGTDAGMPSLVFADGSRGWAVDRCTVVIATDGWVEPTRARIAGRGPSLLAGELPLVVARAGERRHVWAAGKSQPAAMLPGPFAAAQDFALSLELHAGFALDLSIQFADAAQASAAATSIRSQLDAFRSMLPSMGVPQSVADSLATTASGRIATLHAHGDSLAVDAVVDAVNKATGRVEPRLP